MLGKGLADDKGAGKRGDFMCSKPVFGSERSERLNRLRELHNGRRRV
jgi:hypothetical protein